MNDDVLLSREQAAKYLGVKAGTLANWACTKAHTIRMFKIGRLVRYRKSDLDVWIESRVVNSNSTSEYGRLR